MNHERRAVNTFSVAEMVVEIVRLRYIHSYSLANRIFDFARQQLELDTVSDANAKRKAP